MIRISRALAQFWLGMVISGWAFSALADCDAYADRIQQAGTEIKRITLKADAQSADDTGAIECAFDAAGMAGLGTVQLLAGDFYLSELRLENFRGTFEGQSKDSTRLHVIDQSVDCAAQVALDLVPAAIRFQAGTPALRNMTISSDKPCMDASDLAGLVMFTRAQSDTCEAGLVFGTVDRVRLSGVRYFPGSGGVLNAILAAPEGIFDSNSCQNRLNGTLKINRSEFDGFLQAIYTSMHGGAQVDVNFNTFTNVQNGFEMRNSNQLTHVYFNEFNADAGEIQNFNGVIVSSYGADVPSTTAITVLNNQFNIPVEGARAMYAWAISNPYPAINVVFSGNQVVLEGIYNFGVELGGTDNAVVINNIFRGTAKTGVFLGPSPPAVQDVAVLANSFENLTATHAHVHVYNAARAIIGPGQDADVIDDGTGTILTDNNEVF